MDLLARKRLREKRLAEEKAKEEAKEAIFKKPQKAYNLSPKKIVAGIAVLMILFIMYLYFTSESIMGKDCGIMPGVECRELQITSTGISFEAHNFLKEDLNITIQVEGCDENVTNMIKPNEKAQYSFPCRLDEDAIKRKLSFTYVGFSGLPHKKEGYLAGKVD